MSDQPWLRQVEIYIGPLQEWQGGGNQDLAVKMVGDGTNNNLRIRFEIRKSILSIPSPSRISVYNLGKQTRASLQKSIYQLGRSATGSGSGDSIIQPGAMVNLKVGWQNTKIITIFSGSLYGVVSEREGPEIVTNLICLAGYGGTSRGLVTQTWGGGTKLSAIIKALAANFPGISIGPVNITEEYTIGNKGFSCCGLAKDVLNNLSRTYGFSWWIDKGIFNAATDQQAIPGNQQVLISYKNGTLFRAEPMLCGPFQKQNGVTIRALLNPAVEAGNTVQLESSVNPKINGSYLAHTVSMTGDTHSSDWDMNIESFFQGAERAAGQKSS